MGVGGGKCWVPDLPAGWSSRLPSFLLFWGNAQSFLGLATGRRRASHGSVFHFQAPGRDISFPDGVTDDGVFPGDHESHHGSLLMLRRASQQGPLPRSPLPQTLNCGSGRGEDGAPKMTTGELAPGVIEVSVSLWMLQAFWGCSAARGLRPKSLVCYPWKDHLDVALPNSSQLPSFYRQDRWDPDGVIEFTWNQTCLLIYSVKNLPAMQETQAWSLGWEDSPGEGNGNLLQYSCLGNAMDEEPGGPQSMGLHKRQTWLSD